MAKFKLFRMRKHSLKTAFGVTGAKRRFNNSVKRALGVPVRRRSFIARWKTASRKADREARHRAALRAKAARYEHPAIPEKIASPLWTIPTERGILTLTAQDVVLQPYNGLPPMVIVPRRSIVRFDHFTGVPPIFGWQGTMHLIFHTRDGFQLNIRRAPYPEAKEFAAAMMVMQPPPAPRRRRTVASPSSADAPPSPPNAPRVPIMHITREMGIQCLVLKDGTWHGAEASEGQWYESVDNDTVVVMRQEAQGRIFTLETIPVSGVYCYLTEPQEHWAYEYGLIRTVYDDAKALILTNGHLVKAGPDALFAVQRNSHVVELHRWQDDGSTMVTKQMPTAQVLFPLSQDALEAVERTWPNIPSWDEANEQALAGQRRAVLEAEAAAVREHKPAARRWQRKEAP